MGARREHIVFILENKVCAVGSTTAFSLKRSDVVSDPITNVSKGITCVETKLRTALICRRRTKRREVDTMGHETIRERTASTRSGRLQSSACTTSAYRRLALRNAPRTMRMDASRLRATGRSLPILSRIFLTTPFLSMVPQADSVMVRDVAADLFGGVAPRPRQGP